MAAKATGVEVARISVKVSPDTKNFRRELNRDLDQIEKSVKAQVDVEPDTHGFKRKLEAATRGAGGSVKVDVDVDRRNLRQLTGRISDSIASIKPPSIPGGGVGMPGGLGGILTIAGIAAAATLAIGPLLGLVTSALVSLPGLIAAVAVPVGALALGMDGLKKAAERLKAPFDDLKATMSSAVESQFVPVFDKLGAIFPTLKSALPQVTKGMADLAQSFVDTVTSSGGMAQIQSIIGNISTALSAAGPGVSAFTGAFLTLSQQFSEKLPAISGWFNDIGTRFNAWVDKMAASGGLSAAFDGLGATLKTIVDGLAGLGAEGMKFFENPENIKNFTTVLSNLAAGLRDVVTLSNNLSGVWSALAFLTTPTSTAVDSVANAFSGLKDKAAEAWEGIKSTVASGVAAVIGFVAGLPGQIIGAIGDLSGTLVAAGQALMSGLLNGIKAKVQAVYDFVSGIAGKIAALKGPLPYDRTVLVPNGQALMEGLGDGLHDGFGKVLRDVSGMAGQIGDEFNANVDASNPLVKAASGLMSAPVDFVKATGKQFMQDIGISGEGVISKGITEGINYVFQIGSVDEALSIKDRETSKRLLSVVAR